VVATAKTDRPLEGDSRAVIQVSASVSASNGECQCVSVDNRFIHAES